MKYYFKVIYIVARIFLGISLIVGGYEKFEKPTPKTQEVLAKAQKFSSPEQESTLQKILYISGAKQTGYFWQVLGVCELLFGLLVILPRTRLLGAILLLPITLQIFLFHAFLEPEAHLELLNTSLLLLVNIMIVFIERKRILPAIWLRSN